MPAAKSAPGSSLAIAAKKAATTGKVAATKTAAKVTPKAPLANKVINTTGTEGTVSLRGGLMPQAQPDGTYLPWSSAGEAQMATPAWSLETDPLYSSAMAAGQAQFNYARNAALADKQTQELGLSNQRKALDTSATEARRRTAGNYAARGMAGGAAGALSLAEARANAEQVAARTGIADQITALNNNFLQNYGDVTAKNYDWTGTLTGQQYKTQAAQQALEAALSRLGTV
jgi:hypothetical protein